MDHERKKEGDTMIVRKSLIAVCIMNMLGTAYADLPSVLQPALDEATAQLSADSALISGWMTGQLKNAIAYNSTSGNVVPSQLKIFGVEVGVQGVVSSTKVDEDGLHSLPTSLIDTTTMDSFSRLPMPLILGHAKVGLPFFGLDAGIRIGGIPKTTEESGDTQATIKNKVFGIDLRKKIIEEGVTRPFGLTVGLNYTHADGSWDYTSNYDNTSLTFSGQTVNITNGRTVERAEWKTDSVGVQALVNKKVLFLNPYIGASINHNTGDIDNSITTTGTASSPHPLAAGLTQDMTATGADTEKVRKWDIRALLGLELSVLPFTRLGFYGEYAGSQNMSGGIGLRVQFR